MHKIDSHTSVCGLLGYPIGHSVSPAIHNTLAEELGHNMVYVPLAVEEKDLGCVIAGADGWKFPGMNVTIPYKEKVIPFCKELDPFAEKIGAVNTLVRQENGGYKGYNTDAPGLYRALTEEGMDPSGQEVVLLGAGGVAKAIAVLMVEKGAKRLYILNRTLEKAEKLAEDCNRMAGCDLAVPMALSDHQKLTGNGYLAIQATNIGMFPNVDDVVIEDEDFYEKISAGFDTIYNPAETVFMKKCRAHGKKTVNGLKMLLYQGVIAYELWNKVSVPEKLTDQVYERLCEILGTGKEKM